MEWTVRRCNGYGPSIGFFYIFTAGCIADGFATVEFGEGLSCRIVLGRFEVFINRCLLGV